MCQSPQLSAPEQLILRRVTQGAEINLSDKTLGTTTVSVDFLSKLLSGRFKNADTAGNLSVYGIVISNAVFKEQVNVHFEVPYRVQFKNCRFEDGVDFSGSQFDKDLDFASDIFGLSPEDLALAPASYEAEVQVEFTGATVNGTLSFQKSFFYAPLDFTKAHLKELDIVEATYGWDKEDPDIDLTAARVDSDLTLTVSARHPHKVHAQFLNVGGSTSFGSGKSGFFGMHEFDLTYSHFQNLAIYGLKHWLKRVDDGSVSLDGFSFQEISFPDANSVNDTGADTNDCKEDTSPSTLLCLLDSPKAAYSTEPYLQLEQNLNASGHAGRANIAYVHMRNRQRRERLHHPANLFIALIAWLVDWFLKVVIGYGRWPWLAAIWAAGFTGVGMAVFRRDYMKPQADNNETGKKDLGCVPKKAEFSPFWYSLDVLAPAIELGVDKAWEPDTDPKFRWVRTYSYFHRIAGWILAPLVLAAIGGIIH